MGDFGDGVKTGFGGLVKGLYGVGTAGQVTFTTGYSTFKWKNLGPDESGNSWILPFIIGYRHNFSGFYVEPGLGYAVLGDKYKYQGVSVSASDGAFAWGAGNGYAKNGFDGGIPLPGPKQEWNCIDHWNSRWLQFHFWGRSIIIPGCSR